MENVGTVFVHIDSVYFFTVDITTGVCTLFYHKAFFTGFMGFVSEYGSEQAAADNQVIVWFHPSLN